MVCFCVLFLVVPVGSSLLAAYREYLERVFLESSDLCLVDVFSVPSDVDPESPALLEWADFA